MSILLFNISDTRIDSLRLEAHPVVIVLECSSYINPFIFTLRIT